MEHILDVKFELQGSLLRHEIEEFESCSLPATTLYQ